MIASIVLAATIAAQQQFAALPIAQALQQAVRISPDVAQAQARVRENQALLAAARGAAAPALTLGYAAAPQGGNSGATVEQSLATIGAGMTLGDYFAYFPAVRQAQYTLAGAQSDLLDAQRTEREKTIGFYFDALRAVANLRLRSDDVIGAESDLRAARLRFRAGDAPRLDVVRAGVALSGARASLDAAQVDLSNAQEALATETGMPAQVLNAVRTGPPYATPPADPRVAVAAALVRRSDLASARAAVLAQRAAVRVAERSVLPAVSLNAGYTHGYDSGVLVSGPSATVNLSLPISHTASDRAAAEQARLEEAQDKELALERTISVAVASAARTYAETIAAASSAQRAMQGAREALRATEIGYRSGASSSLDVADARRTYVQAALANVTAQYAQAQAAATLQEEMGP